MTEDEAHLVEIGATISTLAASFSYWRANLAEGDGNQTRLERLRSQLARAAKVVERLQKEYTDEHK